MFEKKAEEWIKDHSGLTGSYKFVKYDYDSMQKAYLAGVEFCYNKANEWHYVSEEGTPKTEGHYLVCLRNKDRDIFDCWIYYDEDIGWYSMEARMKDIYAWKEIVLPELKENE